MNQMYTLPALQTSEPETNYQQIQAMPVANWMTALTQGFNTFADIANDMAEASNKEKNVKFVKDNVGNIAKVAAFL